jgi:hypothetical protein
MSFLITTLYTVFLGTLLRNFVVVQVTAAPTPDRPDRTAVNVAPLLCPDNVPRAIPLLSLFLVDWIAFLIVFPPSSAFSMGYSDMVLLMLYIPALAFLGAGVVMSLKDSEQPNASMFVLPLAGYLIVGALADLVWVVIEIAGLASMTGSDASIVLVAGFLYFATRLCTAVLFLRLQRPSFGLQFSVLVFVAIVLKPGLLVVLSHIPATFSLLGGRQ